MTLNPPQSHYTPSIVFDVRNYGAALNDSTDDGAALDAALTAAQTAVTNGAPNAEVFVPGLLRTTRSHSVTTMVTLRMLGGGTNGDSTPNASAYVRAHPSASGLDSIVNLSGNGARLVDGCVIADSKATAALKTTASFTCYILHSNAFGGSSYALWAQAQDTWALLSRFSNPAVGSALFVDSAPDCKFIDCLIVGAAAGNGIVRATGGNSWFMDCHLFPGGGSSCDRGFVLEDGSYTSVIGGYTDALKAANCIYVHIRTTAGGTVLKRPIIMGHQFHADSDTTAGTKQCVQLENLAGGTITGARIVNCDGSGSNTAGCGFANFLNTVAGGTIVGTRLINPTTRFTAALYSGARPVIITKGGLYTAGETAGEPLLTEQGGQSTQTPGAVATVNIPHGLCQAPRFVHVTPANANARGAPTVYYTADATNVILNFSANLTAATQYVWNWYAEV